MERIRYGELPGRVRELVDDIRHGHRLNKLGKQGNRPIKAEGIKDELRGKYATLIEAVSEAFRSQGATHFRISRNGDVVFIDDQNHYGQTFKRLWSLNLPMF